MSLSKQIIYADNDDLLRYLDENHPNKFNEIDEYGYTPLVQTAIINSHDKAKMLLERGADVNFTDLTGRSALHWAADNGNVELVRCFLEAGADANSYTRAGQPVLVMPLLRNHTVIKQLLYRYNADLSFAQDFINAKMLGHRFELQGRIDVVTPDKLFIEMEFEGFYFQFNLQAVLRSLKDFRRNFGGRNYTRYFDKLDLIIDSMENGADLLNYQHYLVDNEQNITAINHHLDHWPLVLPISFDGHAISLIKYGNWLIRCDRGAFGRDNGTVIFYQIGLPERFNKAFIRRLLYTRQYRRFIDQDLITILQLTPQATLPLPVQLSGNCAWANVEAVVPTLMYVLLCEEATAQSAQPDFAHLAAEAMNFHKAWIDWDQERELSFCLQGINELSEARQATKLAILAAILVQRLKFGDQADEQRAEKIVPHLMQKNYRYILQSYYQCLKNDSDSKLLANFVELLDHAGVDANQLEK